MGVKLTLGPRNGDGKVEVDGVELPDVTHVQVVCGVNARALVIVTMSPRDAVEIEGDADVQTVVSGPGMYAPNTGGGALLPRAVAEQLGATLGLPQVLRGRGRVVVQLGTNDQADANAWVAANAGTPSYYTRCDDRRGGRVCERGIGHDGRHLAIVYELRPGPDRRVTELWSWGPPGNVDPTRVHTAQCAHCDAQMRPDLVTINLVRAPLFVCGHAGDCSRRAERRPRCHHRERLESGPSPFWCTLHRGHGGAHAVGDVPPHTCDDCGAESASDAGLQAHREEHHDDFRD